MIILTGEQAQTVRGPTSNGARLDPIPLADGSFVLPDDVLDDSNHAMWRDYLMALPMRDVDASEWPKASE